MKIIRSATIPLSLNLFCRNLFRELSSVYEVIALSSPMPELDGIGQREGIRTIAVPMRRKISLSRDVVSLIRLLRVFRRERPDMVHSITPKAGLLSMMAAWMASVPVRVHTFTGLIFPYEKGWKHHLLKTTDRVTAACATYVIAEGQGVREDLLNYKITRKPVMVLGNGNLRGIDLNHYARTEEIVHEGWLLRQSSGIPENAFVFLFVGRFDRDKGIDNLAGAFRKLEQVRKNVYLLMVGREEPDGHPVEKQTLEDIRLSDHIICSDGWQEDVRPWFAAADVLVHPSYREGFPNVVIEAGAMGLAAIVTDINGSREIILEGENGVVVPPKDTDALERAMAYFVDNPGTAREMGRKARTMASRYDQKYVWQCLKDFYREVLK